MGRAVQFSPDSALSLLSHLYRLINALAVYSGLPASSLENEWQLKLFLSCPVSGRQREQYALLLTYMTYVTLPERTVTTVGSDVNIYVVLTES